MEGNEAAEREREGEGETEEESGRGEKGNIGGKEGRKVIE